MKKALSLLFVTLSVVLIFVSFNAHDAVVYFLLAGYVPGTSIVVPASAMFTFYCVVATLLAIRIVYSMVHARSVAREQLRISQLPRRRMARIV